MCLLKASNESTKSSVAVLLVNKNLCSVCVCACDGNLKVAHSVCMCVIDAYLSGRRPDSSSFSSWIKQLFSSCVHKCEKMCVRGERGECLLVCVRECVCQRERKTEKQRCNLCCTSDPTALGCLCLCWGLLTWEKEAAHQTFAWAWKGEEVGRRGWSKKLCNLNCLFLRVC